MQEKSIKNKKAFRICNIVLSVLCLCITLGVLIYDVSTNYQFSRFIKAVGIFIVFAIPYLIEFISKKRIGNLTLLIYTIFVIISGLLGALFVMGKYIPFYDKISHTLYGYLACFIGLFFATALNLNAKFSMFATIMFCVMFSIASHAIWEIWEFTFDTLAGFTMQGSKVFGVAPYVTDTMFDIIVNLVGAFVFVMHYQFHFCTNKNLMIGTLKQEFNDFLNINKTKNQK